MGTAKNALNRLDSFNVDATMNRIVYSLEAEIIRLNTQHILNEGKTSEGNIIGIYSRATELISAGKKKAGDPYDLFDTGRLQASWEISYRNDKITFFATDEKLGEVLNTIEKHGLINNPKEIFGLTVTNQRILNIEMLLPELRKRFRNETGL